MSINSEFTDFLRGWTTKATAIRLTDLNSHFDRFFTLFVIYNRLYAEATFILGRRSQIDLQKRKTFPDSQAATSYVAKFIGAKDLVNFIEDDDATRQALDQIRSMIRTNRFSVKLNMVTGDRQREEDVALLERLESKHDNTKASAILETLYAVRCNMFHGNKAFDPIQAEILAPILEILTKTIDLLQQKIKAA